MVLHSYKMLSSDENILLDMGSSETSQGALKSHTVVLKIVLFNVFWFLEIHTSSLSSLLCAPFLSTTCLTKSLGEQEKKNLPWNSKIYLFICFGGGCYTKVLNFKKYFVIDLTTETFHNNLKYFPVVWCVLGVVKTSRIIIFSFF